MEALRHTYPIVIHTSKASARSLATTVERIEARLNKQRSIRVVITENGTEFSFFVIKTCTSEFRDCVQCVHNFGDEGITIEPWRNWKTDLLDLLSGNSPLTGFCKPIAKHSYCQVY